MWVPGKCDRGLVGMWSWVSGNVMVGLVGSVISCVEVDLPSLPQVTTAVICLQQFADSVDNFLSIQVVRSLPTGRFLPVYSLV